MAKDATPYSLQTFTASDGYRWQYRRYQPAQQAKGHVVCLHGIQSHAGWYEYSCKRLSEAGFLVDFLDRRGSGMNQQDRGDTPGFRRLLLDVAEFLDAQRQNERPLFLLAISWGGKLATALQRFRPVPLAGLALITPGFFAQVGLPRRVRLAIARSRMLAPRRLFPIPLSDAELFTATPHWQQFLRDDPLSLHQATARFLFESFRLDAYLRFVPSKVRLPVLLMLAEKDRIISNPRTRRYVGRFASPYRQIIEYPDASHTLEFEPEPEFFVTDLLDWLLRHRGR